ncbi:valine--tRNA ligase [Corynebacterium sp. 320]|uniref:valine--tRNA ligase n=1 Tax=Corynebacterium TaxID=1716 RepID=UPI00125CA9EF|nr:MULTISPECIES: valine--tRNA ligase [Corynebacterium]KAB1502588.1 valine--tRNA ligase [Corynebacterium sp. 320]KAB1551538.1 valine--tRNA ligase [Corynebacterium sp. 321]KAB1551995.1 valine--tRNA ligase [Corynebacterium sp. 319]KAB3526195.1 valine--tRNA ligase [Corynebacterium sp. 250]KAB3538989.1 valine--tRNA ligase [Corynebacterium sp. 366]
MGADRSAQLPKAWEPSAVESTLYKRWVDAGYFTADAGSSKPPFSIVLPPPNVTGQLHMGHALDHTLMDAMARRKRMQGFEVLWLPGSDHAGIATQTKVEASLKENEGTDRFDLGREAFVDRVWEWKHDYGNVIQNQMRAIGDSVDWSRERFTLDEGLSRAVQTMFKALYDEGLIYRAHRLVNWSPVLQTAISDIEVVYSDDEGELVSIRYGSLNDNEPHVIVATTRVETMLGDVAVAVHPEDERYADLVGTTLDHPFLPDRKMIVVADDYVDPEFGTGAVKITPAHDPNDFALGQRHDLEMPVILDATGHITDTGTQFDGMDRYEAREKIRLALEEQGRIVERKFPYVHSVGHSERSGEAIEPRLSEQWFVKVEKLATMSAEAIRSGDSTIYPASQEPRWFDWVDDMHDWCISRQLWWGHRIPIWYGPDGEVVCCGPDDEPPTGEGWVQDEDVLDTWFSSALWPFSTMGWPANTEDLQKFYPVSVLVTGYDILFFWVARMMMFATFADTLKDSPLANTIPGIPSVDRDGRPQIPFKDIFLHGLVRDEKGRKMSKSLGNGINPMDWVENYGADALRFTLARGANPGSDLPVGEDSAQSSRNFATKLYNATKFALMNGAQVGDLPEREALTGADRWILDRLESVRALVDNALDRYEFSLANENLYRFAWGEFCDWYLEIAKVQIPRNWDEASEAEKARGINTQLVLGRVLDTVLRLLHPAMPFVTETLWTALTHGVDGYPESLVVAPWPDSDLTNGGAEVDQDAIRRMADVDKLVTELRRFRSDQGVKPTQKVPAMLDFAAADLEEFEPAVRSIVRLEEPDEGFAATASIEVRLSQATIEVQLDTSGTVDVAAERKRLEKDLAAAQKELDNAAKKLSNEGFLANAPEKVVEGIKERQKIAQEEFARITSRLEELPQA